MSKTNQGRGLVPSVSDAQDKGGEPSRPIRDPLAWMSEQVSDDPTLAELLSFRASRPDLKAFAREAKRCDDEAARLPFGLDQTDEHKMAQVGLKIVGLSCAAIVAIWPTDTIDEADAKQGLALATRVHGDDTAYAVAPMLTVLHSADAQAKLRLVACINDRACRGDPLHQQAAIRHVISQANWIAMAFRFGATLELRPDWIPIV